MKLKFFALAALMAAGSANAAIDNGNGGNGDLFFNIWDADGSYSRDLGFSIDTFQTTLAVVGSIDLSWAADATFTSFLAGVADASKLKWNIMATDTSGARRVLSTYNLPEKSPTIKNDVLRTVALNTQLFVGDVNAALGANNSVAVTSASTAWAGKNSFNEFVGKVSPNLNFSNAGTLADNNYATGLGFMRIDGAATGIASSVYNEYSDNTVAVNAWLDGGNTLHIAAVPEPETVRAD